MDGERHEARAPLPRRHIGLDAPVLVVATIALREGGIIDRIKKRADVRLYRVTKENRESLVDEIEAAVRESLDFRAKGGSQPSSDEGLLPVIDSIPVSLPWAESYW